MNEVVSAMNSNMRAKKEGDTNQNKFHKTISNSSSSSRHWSSHKNPRIVRVSRTFGGKDRHSKVTTIRGLRDRRIRLSVPTAIQLYDLQDRLGLGQPSKVIDWLLDATKHEIDKLPPLPMLPENFTQLYESSSSANPQQYHDQKINDQRGIHQASYDHHHHQQQQQQQENQGSLGGFVEQNFFPLANFANLPYNPHFHWDPASLSLSQFGPFTNNQTQDHPHPHPHHHQLHNNLSFPSSSQLFFPTMENEWRQMNSLQQNHPLPTTLHLISSPVRSHVALNVNSKQQTSSERLDKNGRS